jgi:hypothetical protein
MNAGVVLNVPRDAGADRIRTVLTSGRQGAVLHIPHALLATGGELFE